jgi:hypothetical protein
MGESISVARGRPLSSMHDPAYPSTIFRTFHTLKKVAYVRGFSTVSQFARSLSGTLPVEISATHAMRPVCIGMTVGWLPGGSLDFSSE